MEIQITGWDKYNPRKDITKPSWFRLDNSLITDPEFFDFDNDEKMVWIGLLCLASQKNSGTVKTNISLISALLKIEHKKIDESLIKLQKIGVISIRTVDSESDVTSTSRPRNATDGRTNEHNERTNETDIQSTQKSADPVKVNETEIKLIESWNGLKGLQKHKPTEATIRKVRKKLKKRRKDYSLEDILQAIKNYHEALTYGWFSYKWPLWDFLGRENASKFYPDEYVPENFLKGDAAKINRVKNMENPYAS